MTITLEKIKEMNIPVGTPIEINFLNTKLMGYFIGLEKKEDGHDILKYASSTEEIKNFGWRPYGNKCIISNLKEIKILEYKK